MRRAAGQKQTPAGRDVIDACRRFPWLAVTVYFLLGLLCRSVVFTGVHEEGDEIIYSTLVQELEAGRGYTLRATPLIGAWLPAELYGKALFFHPPGGIALFWLLHRVVGDAGYPLAQMLSYAVFFWSMLFLGSVVHFPLRGPTVHLLAALSAFTPIMAHVTSRFWLDGPLLAFSTLASALFMFAVVRGSARWATLAGLVMGYASGIKSAAFLIVPGLLLLAWAVTDPSSRRITLRLSMVFTGVAVLIQIPWELWHWAVVGSPFPASAGRPTPRFLETNEYLFHVTVVRSPWIYLTLMPRVLWTLLPSIACLCAPRLDPRVRRIGGSLLAWVLMILAAVVVLGFFGYSKLLRYAILVTPATVLLFALVAGETLNRRADQSLTRGEKMLVRVLVAAAVAGFVLEIGQGIFTPLVDSRNDLIRPLLFPDAGDL